MWFFVYLQQVDDVLVLVEVAKNYSTCRKDVGFVKLRSSWLFRPTITDSQTLTTISLSKQLYKVHCGCFCNRRTSKSSELESRSNWITNSEDFSGLRLRPTNCTSQLGLLIALRSIGNQIVRCHSHFDKAYPPSCKFMSAPVDGRWILPEVSKLRVGEIKTILWNNCTCLGGGGDWAAVAHKAEYIFCMFLQQQALEMFVQLASESVIASYSSSISWIPHAHSIICRREK